MSLYRYEALDKTGNVVMGAMDAPSEAAVSARLTQMGYTPRQVVSPSSSRTSTRARKKPGLFHGLANRGSAGPKHLALFFRQFAALMRAGISPYQAMETLAPRTDQPHIAKAAREMSEAAKAGGRISDVMEQYPGVFAPHAVGAVRAGELGGFLEIVLDELAYDYEQEIAFYKGLWLIKWFALQGILAIAVLQPFFNKLFAVDKKTVSDYSIGEQMKEFLQVVAFRNLPIALVIILAGALIYRWWKKPANRSLRERAILKLPVFGDLARQRALSAFIRMLRKLFVAGLSPNQSWEGAMHVAPNVEIRARLIETYSMMQRGVPIHDAFTATGLFANETEQLLATGVVSGQVVEMMDRIAEYYQHNVDEAFRNSRFWMWRLGIAMSIAFVGALAILFFKTYITALFDNPFVRPDP